MNKLIGIVGHAGVGKDTAARYLNSKYDFTQIAFADPLKRACAAAFNISYLNFHDPRLKEEVDPYWGVSPRQVAQFVGTEMFRETVEKLIPGIGSDFWVRRAEQEIQLNDLDKVVISDVRFQNEVDWILKSGGSILEIKRFGHHGTVGIKNHASENLSSLNLGVTSYVIYNDDTLSVLYRKLDEFVNTLNSQRK